MKPIPFRWFPIRRSLAVVGCLGMLASVAVAQSEQQDPILALKSKDPKTNDSKAEVDPSVASGSEDFHSRSDIVCYAGAATLIPKRAILQIPKNLQDRLVAQPGAKVKSWADFYADNRSWITTVEVSPAQAEGKLPLADGIKTQIVKSGNLIVATFRGGPISVLPLQLPDPNASNPKTHKP